MVRFPGPTAAFSAFLLFGLSGIGAPDDVLVNDSGDALHDPGCALTGTGTCTLRDAITFANGHAGRDVIRMAGVVARPTSALPRITDSLTLDGTYYWYSSPGVIDGTLAGLVDGLVLAADGNALFGITVQGFEGAGIVILSSHNLLGAFIPPPCTLGCAMKEVEVAGNGSHGIEIRGGAENALDVVGATLNGGDGIVVRAGGKLNRIGTTTYGFNTSRAYGNRRAGVRIGDGVSDEQTRNNSIDLGTLYGNGTLGIDLGGDGATPNDPLDADAGPNALQNAPTVISAVTNANNTATVMGTFNGAPNAAFNLHFYRADKGSSSFVEDVTVTTDANGSASFVAVLTTRFYEATPPPGLALPLVATATDAGGNTSELSGPVATAEARTLSFHTVDPCRIVDTRDPYPGPLVNLRPRLFVEAGPGPCNIPSTARALVLNVTVTNATAGGHVQVATTPWAADTSTINFSAGQTRANSAIVALDAWGSFTARAVLEGPGTVDLILDVSGYLE